MTLTQTLHQQLVQLRGQAHDWVAGQPVAGFKPWRGICSHLDLGVADWRQFGALLTAWPGSSGNGDFPVPHPRFVPATAFVTSPPQEMWNPEFEYARNRWALLDWLIEQTSTTTTN